MVDGPNDHLYFRPSARLQRFLGSELIADPNVAVIEFVKNSYDAGAAHVVVEFALAGDPRTLTISDDGVGLNLKLFRDNWMHPGFSAKANQATARKADRNATPAQAREASRVPVGEKGIGRLAAGRLGEKLDVYTRRASNRPWLHVHFNWADFDSMSTPLDEVPIAYDDDAPGDPPFPVGTILVISRLSQAWDQRVRGRAVRGRRRTKLGRLKQDLEFLVRPMGVTEQNFSITLLSDMIRDPEDVGDITAVSAVAESAYKYEFSYSVADGAASIARSVTRSALAADEARMPCTETLKSVSIDAASGKIEGRPDEFLCGAFTGQFLYDPPAARQRAREINVSPVGVLLYRDGLLVEPYGIGENDWLGARARKAQRQGYAVQPDTLSGHVVISRQGNPALRDQSNRLGLLDTPESENFLEHLQAEFLVFEKLVLHEVLESRWEGNKQAKAAEDARESQERARILLRALAHALRQPLQGLGFEVATINALRSTADLPPETAVALGEVAERVSGHVRVAEGLIGPLLERQTSDFAEISTREIVRSAVDQTRMLASGTGVAVKTNAIATAVLVPPSLVVQALAALLSNAIEAPRSAGVHPTVTVTAARRNGDVVIEVTDNGTGISGASEDTALASIASTKGRPEVGLQNAETSLVAAKGRLRLVATGAQGTTFEVRLPTRVAGLASSVE